MRSLRAVLITLIAILGTPSEATHALPFVGTRELNFLGGTGTVLVARIDADGHTHIWTVGLCGYREVYAGAFRTRMAIHDREEVSLGKTRARWYVNGAAAKSCGLQAGAPCTATYTPAAWWPHQYQPKAWCSD